MAWPRVVELTVTCPQCGTTATVEAIHQPHHRVYNSRDRIYKSLTCVTCPRCENEWELQDNSSCGPVSEPCS